MLTYLPIQCVSLIAATHTAKLRLAVYVSNSISGTLHQQFLANRLDRSFAIGGVMIDRAWLIMVDPQNDPALVRRLAGNNDYQPNCLVYICCCGPYRSDRPTTPAVGIVTGPLM